MSGISRRNIIKAGAILGCAGIGGKLGYDMLKDPLDKLDDAFVDAIQELPAASISAAIFKNHQVYWSNNYGYQDIASRHMMTENSAWQTIGSISKLIVWTAIMQLVERGDLDIQRDVSDYIGFQLRSPHYPDTKITTYHLLTHSSSLSSRKLMSAPEPMADSFCEKSDENLDKWVQRYMSSASDDYNESLIFEEYEAGDFANIAPDPLWVASGYSNLNAVLAAYIVERISARNFESYCEENIFRPCGMAQTSWSKMKSLEWMTHYEATHSQRAPIMRAYTKAMIDKGYTSKEVIASPAGRDYLDFTNCNYFSSVYPMGLLGTSLQSILPFFLAYLNQGQVNGYSLLRPETINDVFTLQRKDHVTGAELGLGWFNKMRSKDAGRWGHDGGGPGVLSTVSINPNKGAGVLLFINNFHVNYERRAKLLNTMNEIAYGA